MSMKINAEYIEHNGTEKLRCVWQNDYFYCLLHLANEAKIKTIIRKYYKEEDWTMTSAPKPKARTTPLRKPKSGMPSIERLKIPYPTPQEIGTLWTYKPKGKPATRMTLAWVGREAYIYEEINNPKHIEIIEKDYWRLDYWVKDNRGF